MIASRCGATFGRSSITVASTNSTRQPSAATRATASRSSASESAPLNAGSVSGKCWPMSPMRRRAQHRVGDRVGEHVGVRPAREPAVVRDLDAAQDQRPPLGEAMRVDPEPEPHPSGSIRRARRSNTAISFTPQSRSSSTACS